MLVHEEKKRINSTLESGIASYAISFLSFSYSQGISTHESCKDSVCYYEHSLKLKNCRKCKEKYNNKWESVWMNGEWASVKVFVWLIRLFPGNFFPAPSMTLCDNDCRKKQQ